MLELNRETYVIRRLDTGSSDILLPIYNSELEYLNETVVVTDTGVDIHKLDPIVATLRLRLDSSPESRLEQGSVTLEVLRGILFVQEEAVVTASVVLRDGRRSLITNSSELSVSSSNSSIVSVTDNILLGVSEGEAVINITWINAACDVGILSTEVAVTVKADICRPTFVPPSQTTTVPEDSPIGHKIVTISAVVQDDICSVEESATDTQYRFQNGFNFDGLFSLNPTSGELVLNGQLDRETTDLYVLLIEATNSAQRRAEQGIREEGEGEGEDEVSGSGSGDGGMITPDPTDNTTVSLNIAVLTVSSLTCTFNQLPEMGAPQ